jgi:exonuclease SbcC
MRINRLRLSNFRQHVDTQIDFESGITGIIGPNGSGKSTLLEAIAWALYGTPAARGTRDSIRSYRAPARAQVKVELDFDLGGHRYLVSRGLNNAELFLDGSSVPIATSISAVSDLLRRRLGMSHDEFFNTYFTGQKELGVMAAMGPTERAQFLSRVLGYERLKTAQELIRKRRSALDAEIKGLRTGMADPIAVQKTLIEARQRVAAAEAVVATAAVRRDRARTVLTEITPQWERAQRERDLEQSLVAELRVAESERDARQRDMDRIQRELAEIAAARTELESLTVELSALAGLETELRDLERASNERARHKTLTDNIRIAKGEIEAWVARRGQIETAPMVEAEAAEELAKTRAELEQVQSQFETAHAEWIRDKQEAETKREALLAQLKDVQQQRDQIVELGEGGICPICARPLETHFRSVLDVLEAQIETITFNGKYFRSRMEQLATMPPAVATLDERRRPLPERIAKLERRLVNAQNAVQEMTTLARNLDAKTHHHDALVAELATIAVAYDEGRHAIVKTAVARLTPLAARAARLITQLEREKPLGEEADRGRVVQTEIAARLTDITTRRTTLAFSEQTFATTRDGFDRAATTLRDAELAAV